MEDPDYKVPKWVLYPGWIAIGILVGLIIWLIIGCGPSPASQAEERLRQRCREFCVNREGFVWLGYSGHGGYRCVCSDGTDVTAPGI